MKSRRKIFLLLAKNAEDCLRLENIAIFYLPVTLNELIFSLLTNGTEITKRVLNNNASVYIYMLFAMTSNVRKKRENFKINRKGGGFKKTH